MIILESKSSSRGEAIRIAAIGSCRVHMPLSVLAQQGRLRICDNGLNGTHSAPEALQSLNLVLGDIDIPDTLSPYIFDTEAAPSGSFLGQTVRNGVDVFLLEVSDDRQFMFGEFCLQQNFVTRNLIQPHRGAMLGWYREVCQGGPASEETVSTALEKLERAGFRHDDQMAALLRGITLQRQDSVVIAEAVKTMMEKAGGRWIIVSSFDIAEDNGAVMMDRRLLQEKLREAAIACGAEFYDPSHLIELHGRSVALDGGGADIYEYAPEFYLTVGESFLNVIGIPDIPEEAAFNPQDLANRVDEQLVQLHTQRLKDLGVDGSGLMAHYQSLMERGPLVGPREIAVLDLVSSYLPPYAEYAVMRAGLGELALLLAASGRKTTAYEPNARRRAAIEAGLNHFESNGLMAPGALTIMDTLTPPTALKAKTLGIGLNVIGARDDTESNRYLANMPRFDALLVDLRLMFRVREDAAEQEGVATSLDHLGFGKRRDYRREGLSWFSKQQAGETPAEPPASTSKVEADLAPAPAPVSLLKSEALEPAIGAAIIPDREGSFWERLLGATKRAVGRN